MKKLAVPFLFLSLAVAPVGCGKSDPGKKADPVQVSGKVTLKGQPVNDATLNLQPTGDGVEAVFPLKNGGFQGTVVPGKYAYYLTPRTAGKAIPREYQAGSLDRQVDITGGTVELKFD